MENRDLEKDKLNTEPQPINTAQETENNHVGDAVQSASTDAAGKGTSNESNIEDTLVHAVPSSTTSESESEEDAHVVGKQEDEETKIYSSTDRTPLETSRDAEHTVDMSKDTIVHTSAKTDSERKSRSNDSFILAADGENETKPSEAEEGKKDTREERNKQKKRRKERVRLIPIWLRLFIVILLCGLSLVGGLMFGYGVLGDGIPTDILKRETWEHIINIISGTE